MSAASTNQRSNPSATGMGSVTSSCSRTCRNHTIARYLSVPTACATRSTCSCARRASSSAGSPYISRASIWARTAANSSVVVCMFLPLSVSTGCEGATPIRCVPRSLPPQSSDCRLVCALACGCSRYGVAAVPVDARDRTDRQRKDSRRPTFLRVATTTMAISGGSASSGAPAIGIVLKTSSAASRRADSPPLLDVNSTCTSYSFVPFVPSFRRLRIVRRTPRALRVLVVFVPVVLVASQALGPVAHPLGAVRAERPRSIPSVGAAGLVSLAAAREQTSPTGSWRGPVATRFRRSAARRAFRLSPRTASACSNRSVGARATGGMRRTGSQPRTLCLPPCRPGGWSLRSTPPTCWRSKRPPGT